MLPLSPMKMLAGEKLKQRKPSNEPSSSDKEAATNHCWIGIERVAIRNAVVQTAATPADKPSMLSRKLNALVIAPIQSTVTMIESALPRGMSSRPNLWIEQHQRRDDGQLHE